MNWRGIPSLNSLRAFSAVADTLSFSSAGRALNVSHAAISQQVRALEEFLGASLVTRQGRGLALTADGARLAANLEAGFQSIREAIDVLTHADATRPLHVTMTPTFAVSWLMPRISDFRHHHPDIELMLNPTADVVDLKPGDVDLAIRFGNGDWPGVESELLLATDFVVVGATSLVGEGEISDPHAVLAYPWLQELGTHELSGWLTRQGVVATNKLNITHLPGYMVLDGLRRGDGISATSRAFIEADIEAGNLRVLFEHDRAGSGYHIVTRSGVMRPPLKSFVSWLRNRVREQSEASA